MSKRITPPTSQPIPPQQNGKVLQIPVPPDTIILRPPADPMGGLRRITFAATQTLPPGMERTLEYPEE